MSGLCGTCGHVPERHVDGRCEAAVRGPEPGRGVQCPCTAYVPGPMRSTDPATKQEMDEVISVARMKDPEHYKAVYAIPHTETHACVVEGCRISQEEHHRLTYGHLDQIATLKRRVAELERGQA